MLFTCTLFNIGDLLSIEIDQFSFSPGPHVLIITFNLTSGAEGVFMYNFTGEERPRKFNEGLFTHH